jgi:hypothetical protein
VPTKSEKGDPKGSPFSFASEKVLAGVQGRGSSLNVSFIAAGDPLA